jgi:hypothetical protein
VTKGLKVIRMPNCDPVCENGRNAATDKHCHFALLSLPYLHERGSCAKIDKHSTVPVYLQLEQYLNGQIAADAKARRRDPLKTRCATICHFPNDRA